MRTIRTVTVTIKPGCDVGEAARDLAALARILGMEVASTFDGSPMAAYPDGEPGIVVQQWAKKRREVLGIKD